MQQHTDWMTQAITDLELCGLSQVQGTPLAAMSQYDAVPGFQTEDCVRVLAFSCVTDTDLALVQFWAHRGAALVDVHITRCPRAIVFDKNGRLKQTSTYTPNLSPAQAWTMAKSVLTPVETLAYN